MAFMDTDDNKRSLIMSEIMTPDKANFGGNVHGGFILSLLDRVAYSCAARYCQHYAVTLSVDEVQFKKPIHVGELVTFYAKVNYTGNTSMEIGIKVMAENLLTGEKRHTNSCFFTMVAVDENFRPCKVPPLNPSSKTDKRRFEAAKLRREMRKQLESQQTLAHQLLKDRFEKE